MTGGSWRDVLLYTVGGLVLAGTVHFAERRGGIVFLDESQAEDVLKDRRLKLPAAGGDGGPMGARPPRRIPLLLRLREAAWVAVLPACLVSALIMRWAFHWELPYVAILLVVGLLGAAAVVLTFEALVILMQAYRVAWAGRVAD